MAKIKLRSGRELSDYGRPYFVAEVNSSHNGNVEVAKQMIAAAAEAGCDCVKFQSWSAESLYSQSYYNDNPIAKRIVAKFSLTAEQLKEMAAYAREKGIDFSSTPYSCEEVDSFCEDSLDGFEQSEVPALYSQKKCSYCAIHWYEHDGGD
jgi:N-acetylneuraminate synthase